MNFFITSAFASEAASQTSSIITNLMPIALIMVVFYFLLLRPQQKKMKEHQLLIKSLEKGNEVSFCGGMMGVVVKSDNDTHIMVEIAPEVKIKIRRDAVTEVINSPAIVQPNKTNAEAKPDSQPKPEKSLKLKKPKKN